MGSQPSARDPRTPRLQLVTPGPAEAREEAARRDGALLEAFERGDPGAGGALYDRLFPVVDATLYRILGRREHDHADLVQSAFEQIVSTLARRSFARDCSLPGWAAVLACHVGLNALRSRRRERVVIDRSAHHAPDLHDVYDRAPAPGAERASPARLEAQLGARAELEMVRHALGAMDPARATALMLHAMGHDLAEIARLTKVSVAAAQSRLSRGRRELRERVDANAKREREHEEAVMTGDVRDDETNVWLDALVEGEVPPMPAAEADALRARVVDRIEAQRRGAGRARPRALMIFAAAACLPLVVWGAVKLGAARHAQEFAAAGDELRTGVGGSARATLGTGAIVDVGPSARLRFERASTRDGDSAKKRDRIELTDGKIDVQVPKLAPGDEVRVHTRGATVIVHGTKFSVEHVASEGGGAETRIAVTEGKVAVLTDRGERLLGAGSDLIVPDVPEPLAGEGTAPPAPAAPAEAPAASAIAGSSSLSSATSGAPGSMAPPAPQAPSSTLAAENAILAEALRLRRDGQNERALARFDELLDRYPRSPLAETARAERRHVLDDLRARAPAP